MAKMNLPTKTRDISLIVTANAYNSNQTEPQKNRLKTATLDNMSPQH